MELNFEWNLIKNELENKINNYNLMSITLTLRDKKI